MIETKRRPLLSSFLIDWSLLSTFQCYPKIFQYKTTTARVFWSFFFLVFASLTCRLVFKCFTDFAEYEVVTKIKVIPERPITFPAITICDYSPFKSYYAQTLIRNISLETFNKEVESMTFIEIIKNLTNITTLAKMRTADPRFDLKKNLSQPLNLLMKGCFFNKMECDLKKDFVDVYLFENGNCIRFNSIDSNLKQVTETGKDFGLSFILGPLNNFNKYATSLFSGLVIYIHNQTFEPISSEGIQIKTGENTFISLKKTLAKIEPYPYGECRDFTDGFESDLYKFIIKSNKTYRQYDCLNLCIQRIIKMKCNCFYTKYPMYIHAEPCLNSTALECISSIERGYANGYSEKCLNECPLECESVTYDYTVSSLIFPSKEFYQATVNDLDFMKRNFAANLSFDLFKEEYLSLNVFISTNKYTLITEIPKITQTDLITNVGGSIGIFLGFSIFSLIEVMELLIQCVFIALFKKRIS